MDKQKLSKLLFDTEALVFSREDSPFWYTSGNFGPYYLNTHYLFGGETRANEFLEVFSRGLDEPEIIRTLVELVRQEMSSNEEFAELIEFMAKSTKGLEFDYISGGERRDFFFSIPLALFLNLPHISIFKSAAAYLSDPSFDNSSLLADGELKGAKVLHVADLLNVASSYTRVWLPCLHRLDAKISDSLLVVSRLQGGEEVLLEAGVRPLSLLSLGEDFFKQAAEANLISASNASLATSFQKDPKGYMREFLDNNPDFLDRAENESKKTAERVQRFRELYPELV